MANTDVQIRIVGKDDATTAFQNVAREAETTRKQVEAFGNSMLSMQSVIRNTAAYASAIAGINGIAAAMHSAVDSAVEFYTTMQTGAISMSGTLMSMAQINGKNIEWNQALTMSRALMQELSDQALVTGASTKEISEVFRAMLPSALNANMTIEQTLKLAGALTTAGKAMGISGDNLSRDIRDVINGKNVERTILGQQLGLTSEDINQAKSSADGLFNFLNERLRGEIEANGHYLDTLEGRWNHFKEAISRITGTALTPALESATQELSTIADKLVRVDVGKGEVVGINGDAIEALQNATIVVEHFGSGIVEVGRDISTILSPALSAAVSLIEVAAQHTAALTETLLTLWVGRKLSYYITDFRNAITGAATAQTTLGRAAEAARTQIVAENEAIEAQTAAQRRAALSKAQSSMSALASVSAGVSNNAETAAIARQVELEAALGNQIRQNIALEAEHASAMTIARTSFEGALAAMQAGEMDLAAQILETTTALEGQGSAAEIMAARANAAIDLVRAGEADLAEQIVSTTLANELQGETSLTAGTQGVEGAAMASEAQTALRARTVETNVATAATGAAAAASGEKVVRMGAVAGSAIKNLTSLAWGLVGGWLGVAAAIGMALYKLYEYASAERDWEENHSYWYKGATWVVDRNGKVTRRDSGAPTVMDWTGVGADWGEEDPNDVEEVRKMNEEHQKELEQQQREEEEAKMAADMEKQQQIMADLQKKRPDLFAGVTGKYAGGGEGGVGGGGGSAASEATKATQDAAKAQREAAQAARDQANANEEYAQIIQENSRKIAQANERVENIISNLNEKMLEMTGTQAEVEFEKLHREIQQTNKELASSIVTLKTFTPKAGAATTTDGTFSIEKNWKEQLLSGDDAITTLTAQKLHLLAEKYYELTGEQPTVTSMHRYGNGNSWHDSGQAFDLSDDNLENNPDLRHQLEAYGRQIGLVPLDEYETQYGPNGEYYGSYNVHFSDHGDAIPGGFAPQQTAQPAASVQPTITQDSVTIPQTDVIQTIEEVAQEMNFPYLKLLLALGTYESGDQHNVATIGSNNYNPSSGAAGPFQIIPGQDYLGEDGERHAIPDDYASSVRQNTIAAIDMFMGKLRENNGDIWAAVKHYGEGTDEYVAGVRAIYDSIGGDGTNLAPTSTASVGSTIYKSPFLPDAYKKLSEYQKLKIAKIRKDEADRYAKVQWEMGITADEAGIADDGDDRAWAIKRKYLKSYDELSDKETDIYKQTGSRSLASQYTSVMMQKAKLEELASLRDLMKTEHDERLTHYKGLEYLQDEFTVNINKDQQAELESFVEYQQKQLQEAKLTNEQRIKLEQELANNIKELRDLEAKTDWGGGLVKLGQSMKEYTQDIGSAMASGWSSITDTIEGTFDNMLTKNESFAERMRDMYVSVANTILNTMMKIIMQGLIMNTVMKAFGFGTGAMSTDLISGTTGSLLGSLNVGGTGLASSYSYHHSLTGFASGGVVSPGYFIAGEEGKELVEMSGNGYVHNARETAEILGNNIESTGSGIENVEVRIVNQSGQQMKSTQANAQIDGKKLIVTTMLEAVATDYMGSRTMLKGALGNG